MKVFEQEMTSGLYFKTANSGSSITEYLGKAKLEAPLRPGIKSLSRDMRALTSDPGNRDEGKVT